MNFSATEFQSRKSTGWWLAPGCIREIWRGFFRTGATRARRLIACTFFALLVHLGVGLMLAQDAGSGQNTFHVVNNPGGGQFVYGPLPGRGSMAEALVYMLKQVHGHFGDKPEVGKFIQSRDGSAVAAFFSVNATNQGGGPFTGLLIVSLAADHSASAAVLYDARGTFTTSEPAMVKALSAVWHPASGGSNNRAGSQDATASNAEPAPRSAPAATQEEGGPVPLYQTTGGDHSAVISLPQGWRLTWVSGGQLTAAGDKGEMVFLGMIAQNLTQMARDPFVTFINAANTARKRKGLEPGTYKVLSRMNLPGQAVQVIFIVDFNDGIGPRKGSVRVGLLGPRAISVDGSNLPMTVADSEAATLMAVIRSYHQVNSVIAREGAADLARVQADGARAQAQAAAINARRESSNRAFDAHMAAIDQNAAAFDQHMDNIDRQSKSTQEYTLDQSVVSDSESSARGTVSNADADALVRSNPDRFQIVPNQNLIRGRDY